MAAPKRVKCSDPSQEISVKTWVMNVLSLASRPKNRQMQNERNKFQSMKTIMENSQHPTQLGITTREITEQKIPRCKT